MDVAFEGRAVGRLTGTVRGTDYLRIRVDGRVDVDTRMLIETEDGSPMALWAAGVGDPHADEPVADTFANVSLTTAAEDYALVNARQGWGFGRSTSTHTCSE